MNRKLSFAYIFGLLAGAAFADGKAPEIRIVDGQVWMQAEGVPRGRLLRLFDAAKGLNSKVPPELSNRIVSVRFSGLSFDAAIRKIFEGQPFDYVLIQRKGIVLTAVAQQTGTTTAGPSPFAEQAAFPAPGFGQDPDQPAVF